MMDSILALTPWHWLILGLVLFAAEALGAGGFLLGMAVASLLTSIVSWFGLSWQWQIILFAVQSLVFSVAYWKFFRSFNLQRENTQPVNEKMTALVGKTGVLVKVTGRANGKVQLGDTLWDCSFAADLQEGDKIVVTSYQGMTVVVEAL